MVTRESAIAIAIVLTAVVVGDFASAQTQQQIDWCEGKGSPSRDQQVNACSAVIESKRGSPKQLASAFQQRGTAYFYKADYDRAILDYSEGIKHDPQNSEIFDNRCWTRATINQLQEALRDCIESLRLRPNFAPTTDTLGFVYLKLGQFDLAIATYNAALKLAPKSAYSLYGRGVAKLRIGDTVSGNADIAASKAIKDVAKEMAGYGVTP